MKFSFRISTVKNVHKTTEKIIFKDQISKNIHFFPVKNWDFAAFVTVFELSAYIFSNIPEAKATSKLILLINVLSVLIDSLGNVYILLPNRDLRHTPHVVISIHTCSMMIFFWWFHPKKNGLFWNLPRPRVEELSLGLFFANLQWYFSLKQTRHGTVVYYIRDPLWSKFWRDIIHSIQNVWILFSTKFVWSSHVAQ